ncbi:MAG: ATP-binding protein [Caldimonas sp.]
MKAYAFGRLAVTPFTQRSSDKSGLGLGLSIPRQNIEADGGTLSVRDIPGTGCVFTIRVPSRMALSTSRA